jgi:hypothetical protein
MPKRKWTQEYLDALEAAHDSVVSADSRGGLHFWEAVAASLRERISADPPFTVPAVTQKKQALERAALQRNGGGAPITTGWAKLICADRVDSVVKTLWTTVNGSLIDTGAGNMLPLRDFVVSGHKEVVWRGTRFYLEVLTVHKVYTMATLHGVTVGGFPLTATRDGVAVLQRRIDENRELPIADAALVVVGPADKGNNEVLVRGVPTHAVSLLNPPHDFVVPAWATLWAQPKKEKKEKKRAPMVLVLCAQPEYIGGHHLPLAPFHSLGGPPMQMPHDLVVQVDKFPRSVPFRESATEA